jgi:hypothetical protein
LVHLFPNRRVALDFDVRLHEHLRIPGKAVASHAPGLVGELKIGKNPGAGSVLRANLGTAMQKTIELIVIHRLAHIRRDSRVVFTGLPNAIDLNGEEHWNFMSP